jgi:hypothetical protein
MVLYSLCDKVEWPLLHEGAAATSKVGLPVGNGVSTDSVSDGVAVGVLVSEVGLVVEIPGERVAAKSTLGVVKKYSALLAKALSCSITGVALIKVQIQMATRAISSTLIFAWHYNYFLKQTGKNVSLEKVGFQNKLPKYLFSIEREITRLCDFRTVISTVGAEFPNYLGNV